MKIEDLKHLNEHESKELLVEFYNKTNGMFENYKIIRLTGEHIINSKILLMKIKNKKL